MKRLEVSCGLLVTLAGIYTRATYPLQQPAPIPKFEAASIKPCQKGPGRISSSADRLIGWIRSQSFTINAKSEGPASAGAMKGPMMRALLEDSFLAEGDQRIRKSKLIDFPG